MDTDGILHFQAVVLDDEADAWTDARLADVVTALGEMGLSLATELDQPGETIEEDSPPIVFSGSAGDFELNCDDSGGWRWDTPYSTLMKGRHSNRPEAIKELVGAVQAVLEVATPYFGCTWYNTQGSPLWMRGSDPFVAQSGAALEFFGRRYLDTHRGGKPFPSPGSIRVHRRRPIVDCRRSSVR